MYILFLMRILYDIYLHIWWFFRATQVLCPEFITISRSTRASSTRALSETGVCDCVMLYGFFVFRSIAFRVFIIRFEMRFTTIASCYIGRKYRSVYRKSFPFSESARFTSLYGVSCLLRENVVTRTYNEDRYASTGPDSGCRRHTRFIAIFIFFYRKQNVFIHKNGFGVRYENVINSMLLLLLLLLSNRLKKFSPTDFIKGIK